MRRNFEKSHGMRRPRPSQIKAETLRNSNAAQESARVEGVGRVEANLNGLHERKRVAGSAPGVESWECGGTVKRNERTTHLFEVGAQGGQGAMQFVRTAFEAEPAEAGGVHQQFPHEL